MSETATAIYNALKAQADEHSYWVNGWDNQSLDHVTIDGVFDLEAVASAVERARSAEEHAMSATYTAAIGTASDVVEGDYCDVTVAENDIAGYRDDEDGNEIPEYTMGSNIVMPAQETTVRTNEGDPWGRLEVEAAEILAANGWRVVGKWELADNAAYATVELA